MNARQSAALLKDPASVAILTGQQAGVFGGPLYTLLKAVTALQVARRVREEHETPAVAVFWVDEEDHDWDEIRSAQILDAEFNPCRVTVPDVDGAGSQMVSRLVFDASINDAIAELERRLAPTEFTTEVLAQLRAHYRPGAGVARAFASWLDALLGHQGLVVFESADPAAKGLVGDLFVRELEHPGRTAALAHEAAAEMTRLGHQPQVEPGGDSVALFYLDEGGRQAIKRRDGSYAVGEDVRPAGALIDEVRSSPERFSPNVLLRPLVQDRLFPTVCYVSGPSELAYQAQLKRLYREFGVEVPLLYPRATATLLDSAALRFLDRHHLPLEALHAQDDSALNHVLESLLPPTIERALEDTGQDVARRAEGAQAGTRPARPDAGRCGRHHGRARAGRAQVTAPQDRACGQTQRRHAPSPVPSDTQSGVSGRSPAGTRPESDLRVESLRTHARRPPARSPAGRHGEALLADAVEAWGLAPEGLNPMPFDPDYVRLVLNENFEDTKALFLTPLMRIHYAHLVMLAEQRIIPRADAQRIRDALDGIDLEAVQQVRYDGRCEDLFFYLEGLVTRACGEEAAGHLHTARSRNDIDMTLYRMRLRELVLDLIEATLSVRAVFSDLATRHVRTIFPAHTHTQPAQPTTVAHVLLAAIEQLERDTARLLAAFASVNRNPLGACAITGTGFPIDRTRTTELLGFDEPTGNTYGSIAAVDYLLESVAAASVLLVGLGRILQDLLLWSSREFGYLRLPDGFVQSSSVMPQKRNPVALEHARALASKALGQALAIPVAVHNTPFGDVVDTEDDLQPLVASVFKDAGRAAGLTAASMRHAEFDAALMRERATVGWVTITELADTLARDHGLSFRTGHAIAAAVVREAGRQPHARVADLLTQAAAGLGRDIRLSEDEIARVLSPEHFVDVRKTLGGPSPEVAGRAIDVARAHLDADRAATAGLRLGLATAEQRLTEAAEEL